MMPEPGGPVIILGGTGQLAQGLAKEFAALNHDVRLVHRREAELTRPDSVIRALERMAPALVINAAACTNVDWCEDHRDEAQQVNAIAPGILAGWCAQRSIYFVHFSTDYVFDGVKTVPYVESDMPNPISWYGSTKFTGEKKIQSTGGRYLITRVSWLYSHYRPSFVHAVREQLSTWRREYERGMSPQPVLVVGDQFGSPTSVSPLVRKLGSMILARETGLVHVSCAGACSRFEMARQIATVLDIQAELRPCTTAEFPRPARRPVYSALGTERATALDINPMPDWRSALTEFIQETWPVASR